MHMLPKSHNSGFYKHSADSKFHIDYTMVDTPQPEDVRTCIYVCLFVCLSRCLYHMDYTMVDVYVCLFVCLGVYTIDYTMVDVYVCLFVCLGVCIISTIPWWTLLSLKT